MNTKIGPQPTSNQPLRIYLAGPEVFLRNARQIGEAKKALCRKYGFEGDYPLDSGIETAGLSAREAGLLIATANEKLIRSCQVLIANITPFRGPSVDPGTAYEMGFGRGFGLRIFAYTNVSRTFAERTCSLFKIRREADGILRDVNGMYVEEHGLADNLMIEGCLQACEGELVVSQVPEERIFTDPAGFEKCLELISNYRKNIDTKHHK